MDSSHSNTRIADAASGNWVEALLPASWLPYAQLMRLDRPIGWWLLLLPCWWGMVLAQVHLGGGWPNLWHGLLFLFGAIVMRGAGCVLNDLADREFDAQVERTRQRPLPSGRVGVRGAFVFLALLLVLGLAVLLQFNNATIVTGAASLLIVAIYPFMKRVTYWPQVVLGLAFNWGALVGWTAETGTIALPAVALYLGGLFWTLAYDTIYAHQDKEDDILIGVKSTALKLGEATRNWLYGFFALALACFAVAAWQAGAGWPSAVAIIAAALHALWQCRIFDGDNPSLCLQLFKANRTFGLLLLTGFVLDCFM
jgi:4-hydroxybenzoate polyprenyltransferase